MKKILVLLTLSAIAVIVARFLPTAQWKLIALLISAIFLFISFFVGETKDKFDEPDFVDIGMMMVGLGGNFFLLFLYFLGAIIYCFGMPHFINMFGAWEWLWYTMFSCYAGRILTFFGFEKGVFTSYETINKVTRIG